MAGFFYPMTNTTNTIKAAKAATARKTNTPAARTDGKLPIYLPAAAVRLLEELCGVLDLPNAEEYAEHVIAADIMDTLQSRPRSQHGAIEAMDNLYTLTPANHKAMQSVVDRWNAKKSKKKAKA